MICIARLPSVPCSYHVSVPHLLFTRPGVLDVVVGRSLVDERFLRGLEAAEPANYGSQPLQLRACVASEVLEWPLVPEVVFTYWMKTRLVWGRWFLGRRV